MATLKATPRPDAAAVDLLLTDRAKVTGVLRADATGTRLVRVTGTFADEPNTITDWEPAVGGLVEYRLVGTDENFVPFNVSAWADLRGVAGPVFSLPFRPGYRAFPDAVTRFDATRDSTTKFHPVIGRDDPLVVVGRMAPQRGTFEVTAGTRDALVPLEELLALGETVQYRQSEHPGLDMYFIAERLALAADPEREEWTLAVSFTQVSFPAGYIRSGARGWTFDDLSATNMRYPDVTAGYRSFVALAAGDAL